MCDAPAKSFSFNIKRHTGYSSCSKCLITGKAVLLRTPGRGKKKKKRVCFAGIWPFNLKNDKDFSDNVYNDFEESECTILKDIPGFGCIT